MAKWWTMQSILDSRTCLPMYEYMCICNVFMCLYICIRVICICACLYVFAYFELCVFGIKIVHIFIFETRSITSKKLRSDWPNIYFYKIVLVYIYYLKTQGQPSQISCFFWLYTTCLKGKRPPLNKIIKKTPWSESASEIYRPSDRCLSAKWLPTFADRGCHVVSVTDPHCHILNFLDRSRYFSI
jgi:hypothetical protein